MTTDEKTLADLVDFARHEIVSADVEPWALMIRGLLDRGRVDDEGALWLVKLYNAYDTLDSMWSVFKRWPTPTDWLLAPDGAEAGRYFCGRERRNLRGGKVLIHLESYASRVVGRPQRAWLEEGLPSDDAFVNFRAFVPHVRQIWGVGRQTAFEWAEFCAKVADMPIETPDALLWEATGPRKAIERLYGNDDPDVEWLNTHAADAKARIEAAGVQVSWWDFETIICDFNVMRNGRYYPGKHIAMIREEIDGLPDAEDRDLLNEIIEDVLPEAWQDLRTGVDPDLNVAYRDTGLIHLPPTVKDDQ